MLRCRLQSDDQHGEQRFSSGQNYSYDAAGSVTQDAAGQRFGYDAESHQKEFFSASNQTTTPDATYHYDGEGRRVKKIVGTEVTIFVYDASGLLAEEYSTTVVPVEQAKVSYLTTDHLGSPRVITDQNGAVISRKDFTAFGEEVSSLQRVGGTNGNGYDPPNVRQDYTGYEKDGESGLEFAQARYYNTGHGRFTSADPLTASATIRNPQTFNRYSYVINSPYKFVDPLGLALSDIGVVQTGNPALYRYLDTLGARNLMRQALAEQRQKLHQQRGRPAAQPPQTPPEPGGGPNETAQEGNVKRNEDVYYDVEGETAAAAMANADAIKANKNCDAGFPGCTDVRMTNSVGRPGSGKAKKVKGGFEVTENPFSPTVNATITVYLPRWTGYDSATQAERGDWDKMMADLRDHEEGHVDIATQEANKTAKQLAGALPASRTFISKSGTSEGITAAISRRYSRANQVVADGHARFRARNRNYDVLTGHGMIPRSSVQY
jgi:RHS repeat-associated protein